MKTLLAVLRWPFVGQVTMPRWLWTVVLLTLLLNAVPYYIELPW